MRLREMTAEEVDAYKKKYNEEPTVVTAKVLSTLKTNGSTSPKENTKDEPKTSTYTPTSTPNSVVKLNEESINSFINQIEQSIDMINSTWNNIVTTDIETIKNSWASTDAANYIDKLMAEGDKISNIVQGLKLLENTYQKVLQEHAAIEQEVTGSINNI